MTNDEMIQVAGMYLDFLDDIDKIESEIHKLGHEKSTMMAKAKDQEKMLLTCVGASIRERIIPIQDKAVIVTFDGPNSSIRISNRVVTCD